MFSHITLGTNDIAKAKTFYDALFTAAGAEPGTLLPGNRQVLYMHKGGKLAITLPVNDEPATFGNGTTVGLTLDSAAQVDAWHAAGIAHGGTACEDPPGLREKFNLYLAYLRDPDGNKLCAGARPD